MNLLRRMLCSPLPLPHSGEISSHRMICYLLLLECNQSLYGDMEIWTCSWLWRIRGSVWPDLVWRLRRRSVLRWSKHRFRSNRQLKNAFQLQLKHLVRLHPIHL